MKYTNFADIPRFTRSAGYAVDIEWSYLESAIAEYKRQGFNDDPDFQRAHVWTEAQQIAFVEYVLRGGQSGRDILTNCPSWHHKQGEYDEFVLVDGKQRLNAVLRFLRSEIKAFGTYRKDYEGRIRFVSGSFKWHVNDLATRAEVLQWYLDGNAGGTPHTQDELEKVRMMLIKARVRKINTSKVKA